jgi:hypothetical protein
VKRRQAILELAAQAKNVTKSDHTCRKSMNMRRMLNNFERVLFGASCKVSEVRKSTAKTVCLKDAIMAITRLKLIILIPVSSESNQMCQGWILSAPLAGESVF